MENYCIKEEMDKAREEDLFKEIAKKQRMRLSQKEIEQTEFTCWVMNHVDEDLNLYNQEEYKNENYDNVIACDGRTLYDKIGIDILDLEECFVGAYIEDKWTNSIKLIVRVNGEEIGFVIDVA